MGPAGHVAADLGSGFASFGEQFSGQGFFVWEARLSEEVQKPLAVHPTPADAGASQKDYGPCASAIIRWAASSFPFPRSILPR